MRSGIIREGLPMPREPALLTSAGRMPERSQHRVSGGQDVRSERPQTGHGQPRTVTSAARRGSPSRRAARSVDSPPWTQLFSTAPKPSGPDCCSCGTPFDWEGRKASATKLEDAMGQADFWNDTGRAQATVAELKTLNTLLKIGRAHV